MRRVAVIGNAGGGKSTMCRKLSKAQNIPLFPVDQIQWKPGWKPAPPEEVKLRHDQILQLDRWIIDGWGSFDLIESRFQAADTIIFVDHPLAVHYWWAIKRQFACIFAPRTDGPEGCPMLPMTWPLFKMIWNIHSRLRPRLLNLVNSYRADKQVFHITSPRELHKFVLKYC
jgi:adenylate kinase family enzyme